MPSFKDFINEKEHGWKVNRKYRIAAALETMLLGRHNDTLRSVRATNPKELEMGIKVEFEHVPEGIPHTIGEAIATRIALDHLAECKTYYTRLAQMEKECGVKEKEGEE